MRREEEQRVLDSPGAITREWVVTKINKDEEEPRGDHSTPHLLDPLSSCGSSLSHFLVVHVMLMKLTDDDETLSNENNVVHLLVHFFLLLISLSHNIQKASERFSLAWEEACKIERSQSLGVFFFLPMLLSLNIFYGDNTAVAHSSSLLPLHTCTTLILRYTCQQHLYCQAQGRQAM